jgi:hypothetical protein
MQGQPQPQQIRCQCGTGIWVIPPDNIFTRLIRNRNELSSGMSEGSISCPFCKH